MLMDHFYDFRKISKIKIILAALSSAMLRKVINVSAATVEGFKSTKECFFPKIRLCISGYFHFSPEPKAAEDEFFQVGN